MKISKVLVTGASGVVGRALTKKLKELKIDYKTLSRKDTDYSYDDLINHLDGINSIIHLAHNRGIKDNEGISEALRVTKNLYDVADFHKIKNIVYASSISCYDDEKLLPWKERDNNYPCNYYGISKRACEDLSFLYKGLSIKNLRIAHVFSYDEKNNYMVNIFIKKAFNKETLRVNNCKSKREFIYVLDVVDAIIKALNYDKTDIINIGSANNVTNLELAKIINQVFQNDKLEVFVDETKFVKPSYMDLSKAERLLNYKSNYDLCDAFKDIRKECENV